MRIRKLLAEPPQSPERAEHLYPLTEPLCQPGAARDAFFDTAKWSVAQSEGTNQLTAVLAVDVFEFVATACGRTNVDGALSFLERARAVVPEDPQLDVVTARLAAAAERFEAASAAAKRARDAGSHHAIALLANIQARLARDRVGAGFQPGMFDEAIATASVEPKADWQAIDLTAVLSTRARLLIERALWEPEGAREKTLLRARAAFTRLSRSPFVEAVRRSALDHLCFDTPILGAETQFCAEAAEKFGSLGGAAVAGRALETLPKADPERAAGLRKLVDRVAALEADQAVVLVFRGDEAEIVDWARPAARLLSGIQGRGPEWLLVDRTSGPRASALVTRILSLAGIGEPGVRVTPRSDALAVPCLAALATRHEAPDACPVAPSDRRAITSRAPAALAVLVGRDLDAEIDDFNLYEVPTHLLSFRRTNAKKNPEGWLKSLSDVWFVLEPPAP